MNIKHLVFSILSTFWLLGCGQVDEPGSQSKFLKLHDFPSWANGLKLQNVCFSGPYFKNKSDQFKRNEARRVIGAIERWLWPLYVYSGYQAPLLTSNFADNLKDCAEQVAQKSAVLQVYWEDKDGREEAGDGLMFLYKNTSDGVILHEAGHVLGLHDTYVEGVWSCKPGQPSSIMCNHNNSTFFFAPDDIKGMQSLYCAKNSCIRNGLLQMTYLEFNTNRVGSDIESRKGLDIGQCQDACRNLSQCQSWTHVPANHQGPESRCWLKNGTPRPSDQVGFTSGVKVSSINRIQEMQDVNLNGQDYAFLFIKDKEACRAQCFTEFACQAYTWSTLNGGMCALKNIIPSEASKVVGMVSGYKY